MGGFASTHKGHETKASGAGGGTNKLGQQAVASRAGAEDVKMDDTAEASECLDAVGEAQLGSLRVKDPDAWKGIPSPRPRSALKHGSSSVSVAESDASGSFVERTPSGRRMPRKVSFQVHGLTAPESVTSGGAAGEESDGSQQAHKRVKGSEEFSMKFLVEKFYSKVLTLNELRPFFDGVDMLKLKNQQEALMLLVFGGNELLEDELPGLSADLRLIHLHLLFEGLNLHHWQLFADTFSELLDELPQIPEDVKQRAKTYMATTKHHFRPIEPHEWPPKVVYKGWTKRSCPFHTSFKRPADPAAAQSAPGLEGGSGSPSSSAPEAAATSDGGAAADDGSDFVLPGINSPPLCTAAAAPADGLSEPAAEASGTAVADTAEPTPAKAS